MLILLGVCLTIIGCFLMCWAYNTASDFDLLGLVGGAICISIGLAFFVSGFWPSKNYYFVSMTTTDGETKSFLLLKSANPSKAWEAAEAKKNGETNDPWVVEDIRKIE